MEINFRGALKQTGSPIKISSDCESTVTFTAPMSEIAEIVKLTMAIDKEMEITVKWK